MARIPDRDETRRALIVGRRELHAESEDSVSVGYSDGHSGVGWYAWHTDMSSEGSLRLDREDVETEP